jgi:hypothetical protein
LLRAHPPFLVSKPRANEGPAQPLALPASMPSTLRSQGSTLRQIADQLNRLNQTTRGGKPWNQVQANYGSWERC